MVLLPPQHRARIRTAPRGGCGRLARSARASSSPPLSGTAGRPAVDRTLAAPTPDPARDQMAVPRRTPTDPSQEGVDEGRKAASAAGEEWSICGSGRRDAHRRGSGAANPRDRGVARLTAAASPATLRIAGTSCEADMAAGGGRISSAAASTKAAGPARRAARHCAMPARSSSAARPRCSSTRPVGCGPGRERRSSRDQQMGGRRSPAAREGQTIPVGEQDIRVERVEVSRRGATAACHTQRGRGGPPTSGGVHSTPQASSFSARRRAQGRRRQDQAAGPVAQLNARSGRRSPARAERPSIAVPRSLAGGADLPVESPAAAATGRRGSRRPGSHRSSNATTSAAGRQTPGGPAPPRPPVQWPTCSSG